MTKASPGRTDTDPERRRTPRENLQVGDDDDFDFYAPSRATVLPASAESVPQSTSRDGVILSHRAVVAGALMLVTVTAVLVLLLIRGMGDDAVTSGSPGASAEAGAAIAGASGRVTRSGLVKTTKVFSEQDSTEKIAPSSCSCMGARQ